MRERVFYVVMEVEGSVVTLVVPRFGDEVEQALENLFESECLFVSRDMIKCSGDLVEVLDEDLLSENKWLESFVDFKESEWESLLEVLTKDNYRPSIYDKEEEEFNNWQAKSRLELESGVSDLETPLIVYPDEGGSE